MVQLDPQTVRTRSQRAVPVPKAAGRGLTSGAGHLEGTLSTGVKPFRTRRGQV